MIDGENIIPEEERGAAESFVTPETEQVAAGDQVIDEQQRELNNQLFAKAKESFWLEKHGLLKLPLVNRLRESSLAFLKKGGKRLLTTFGAAATLASMVYLEKDQIIESIDTVMKSPVVTNALERSWNQPYLIDARDRVSGTGVTLETTPKETGNLTRENEKLDNQILAEPNKKRRGELVQQRNELNNQYLYSADGTVNLKGTKIIMKEMEALDFKENDRRILKDSGVKIELADPYLRNLTVGPHPFLQPPVNSRRFSTFIKEQTDEHFRYDQLYYQKAFNDGGVKEFLDLANSIVESNLTYDEQTAAWLAPGENGQTELKWGGNDPFTAFLSSDNTAVDQLLMDKKVGVCRHYAEALPMVCEEIKRQHPDKFQNIYVVPLADAYQMHEYDAIYVVRGPHEAQMFVYDPTSGREKGSPSFDLFRTLYHRQIINRSLFVRLSGEYFEHGGTESWEDAAEFLTWAFSDNSPESIHACKPILSRYVDRVIEKFHASGTPEKQQELWAQFNKMLWPFIYQYQLRTGEQLYPVVKPN